MPDRAPARLTRELRRWDGFPYLVLFTFIILGSIVVDLLPGIWHILAIVALSAGGLVILVWLWRWGSRPDAAPRPLTTGEGARFIEAGAGPARYRVATDDTNRFQGALSAARAWEGDAVRAALIPGVTRGPGRDLRVIAQIEASGRFYGAGYLPRAMDQEWLERLLPLGAEGRYLRVPAQILRSGRGTLTVDLDLSGALDALGALDAPPAGGEPEL